MARPRSATVQDLLALLATGKPVSAPVIAKDLGVSRPVVLRLIREAGDQVLSIGSARASRYLARAESEAGSSWPLWRMRPDCTMEELGTLYLLRGERFQFIATGERPNLLRPVEDVTGHFPGLPWFLDDLRPQGFLGRNLAHRRGVALGVPTDLNRWRLRDVLLAITRTGGTGIGDLLLGGTAVRLAMTEIDGPSDTVDASHRVARYSAWAEEALAGEEPGSSPGGEQPKFTSTVLTQEGRYAAMIKFAPRDGERATTRWADLLVCEHLALQSLAEHGLTAADSEIVEAERHLCLEVRRFDRTPNQLGRRGFVSLQALDAAFIGSGERDWGVIGDQLARLDWVTPDTAHHMATLHWFGRLIGNSDMHPGNLGFHLTDDEPLALAPTYDMLPMYLAPSRTGAVRAPEPLLLTPPERAGQTVHIATAAAVATAFWRRVSNSEHIQSDEIRTLARSNYDAVTRFANTFAPH